MTDWWYASLVPDWWYASLVTDWWYTSLVTDWWYASLVTIAVTILMGEVVCGYFLTGEFSTIARKKARQKTSKSKYTVQYFHMKLGTHARVFPQTVALGNSKQWNNTKETEEEGKKRCVSVERRKAGSKIRSPDRRPNYGSGLPSIEKLRP